MPSSITNYRILANDLKPDYKDHIYDNGVLCGRTKQAPVNAVNQPIDTPSVHLLTYDEYLSHRNLDDFDLTEKPDSICTHCWNAL